MPAHRSARLTRSVHAHGARRGPSRRFSLRGGDRARWVVPAIIGLDECERSDPPLSRNVDGQVLDPRLLNWLRIELHQLHDLERHTHFDRETQRARFTTAKRVIM